MPVDPLLPPSGVPWYRSQQFTGLWQASLLLTLTWVLVGAQTGSWDWRAGLLIPLLSNGIIVLKDWFSPTVVAPVSYLNRNNP